MLLLSESERQVSQLIQKTVGRRVVAEKSVCIFNMVSHKIPLNVIKYKIFSKSMNPELFPFPARSLSNER